MRRPGLAGRDRALTASGHVTRTTRGPWVAVIPPKRLLVADGFRPLGIHYDGWSPRRWGSRGRNQGGGDGGALGFSRWCHLSRLTVARLSKP